MKFQLNEQALYFTAAPLNNGKPNPASGTVVTITDVGPFKRNDPQPSNPKFFFGRDADYCVSTCIGPCSALESELTKLQGYEEPQENVEEEPLDAQV